MNTTQGRDPYFPWRHLGLRANPFQSLKREDWAEIAVLPRQIAAWMNKPSSILQVSGPSGAGKTSVLLAIRRELLKEGQSPFYIYLRDGQPEPELRQSPGRTLLLDEAQRLSRRSLDHLFKSANNGSDVERIPSLIISTHKDFSAYARRYSPDYKSFELGVIELEDLELMLDRRIQHFTRNGHSEVHFRPHALRFLLDTFGMDLRAMEAFLYDFFQSIPASPDIGAQMLLEAYRG